MSAEVAEEYARLSLDLRDIVAELSAVGDEMSPGGFYTIAQVLDEAADALDVLAAIEDTGE